MRCRLTPVTKPRWALPLGDDLDASSDAGAPIYWAGAEAKGEDPALPDGAAPLSNFVSGSELVTRRLNQIGLVDFAQGQSMQDQLQVGQALVTAEGDLWRWDGFVARGRRTERCSPKIGATQPFARYRSGFGHGQAGRC